MAMNLNREPPQKRLVDINPHVRDVHKGSTKIRFTPILVFSVQGLFGVTTMFGAKSPWLSGTHTFSGPRASSPRAAYPELSAPDVARHARRVAGCLGALLGSNWLFGLVGRCFDLVSRPLKDPGFNLLKPPIQTTKRGSSGFGGWFKGRLRQQPPF